MTAKYDSSHERDGFTLIELLVVIAIIAILVLCNSWSFTMIEHESV